MTKPIRRVAEGPDPLCVKLPAGPGHSATRTLIIEGLLSSISPRVAHRISAVVFGSSFDSRRDARRCNGTTCTPYLNASRLMGACLTPQ